MQSSAVLFGVRGYIDGCQLQLGKQNMFISMAFSKHKVIFCSQQPAMACLSPDCTFSFICFAFKPSSTPECHLVATFVQLIKLCYNHDTSTKRHSSRKLSIQMNQLTGVFTLCSLSCLCKIHCQDTISFYTSYCSRIKNSKGIMTAGKFPRLQLSDFFLIFAF